MPRDPTLDTPNWASVFAEASDLETWLERAESEDQRNQVRAGLDAFEADVVIAAAVAALPRAVNVLVLAECWCPDVARHVPVLEALARVTNQVRVRYLMLGDRPDVLVRHLTCGGEAVPKMVFFSRDFVECGEWGPMPRSCRRLVAQGRACGDIGTARKLVAKRYAADPRCIEAQEEILENMYVAATPALESPAE